MSVRLKSLSNLNLPELATLHARCFEKSWDLRAWSKLWDQLPLKGYGIWAQNQFIGFLIWQESEDIWDIITFGVDPDWQGKGCGGRLLEVFLKEAKKQNPSKIFLEVKNNNSSAIRLYKKFGFKNLSVRSNYYSLPCGKTMDALVLVYELHAH
jgi:ribosomal-protein-alanine N-acetyltransferase